MKKIRIQLPENSVRTLGLSVRRHRLIELCSEFLALLKKCFGMLTPECAGCPGCDASLRMQLAVTREFAERHPVCAQNSKPRDASINLVSWKCRRWLPAPRIIKRQAGRERRVQHTARHWRSGRNRQPRHKRQAAPNCRDRLGSHERSSNRPRPRPGIRSLGRLFRLTPSHPICLRDFRGQ
jgi:hypothetical protein